LPICKNKSSNQNHKAEEKQASGERFIAIDQRLICDDVHPFECP
jgi:hypothetical protein